MSETLHEAVTAAYEKSMASEPEVAEVVESVSEFEPEVAESVEPDVSEIEDDAPTHWASKDKEVFKSLDKSGKDFLLRRHKEMEAGYTKKQQALAEEAKIAESFRKTMNPHEAYLKQLNIDPLQAVDKLIATEMRLRMASPQERGALLNDLARQYGATFDPNAEAEQIDPKTKIILDELNRQRSLLDSIQNEKKETEMRGYQSQIESFSEAKDASGAYKHPHFETVRHDMGLLMNAGKASTLEEAYEQSILLNVDLRKEYIANLNRSESDSRKVSDSKRAGFNVKSGSSGSITDSKKEMTLNQTIRAALEAQLKGSRI